MLCARGAQKDASAGGGGDGCDCGVSVVCAWRGRNDQEHAGGAVGPCDVYALFHALLLGKVHAVVRGSEECVRACVPFSYV